MNSSEMSLLNDDGIPLNLNTVLALFLMSNFTMIILTSFIAYLVYLSKNHPQLNYMLGKIANIFAKGALDRIIQNMIQHFEMKEYEYERPQIPLRQMRSLSTGKPSVLSKDSSVSNSNFISEKKYGANYLLLVPFQIDLLCTVFVYKILTRDVYPETCQSYLTTYHNRQRQVVCWLKNINKNISNLSTNVTLYQYCTNQTITYINYEHNDVICIQYVFKLINIIDTITNMIAWHQAIVFIVTKSIVFSYWYQHKLRKSICWPNLFHHQRHIILFLSISSILSIYILLFVFILPIRFFLLEQKRVDLTRHLLYACSKFLTAILLHVNLYTLYQWYSLMTQRHSVLVINEEKKIVYDQSVESIISSTNSEYDSVPSTTIVDDCLSPSSRIYLTPTHSSV